MAHQRTDPGRGAVSPEEGLLTRGSLMQTGESLLTDRPGLLAQPQAAELTADKVVVRFGGLAAISEVSLTIRRHEVFGLIGPNGAGKTTLVNCLTGFQRPAGGRVTVGGEDATGWTAPAFRERGVARTFQAGRLFKDMTVIENV